MLNINCIFFYYILLNMKHNKENIPSDEINFHNYKDNKMPPKYNK